MTKTQELPLMGREEGDRTPKGTAGPWFGPWTRKGPSLGHLTKLEAGV